MKKAAALLLLLVLFAGCSKNLTEHDDVVKVFYDNEEVFRSAVLTCDFSAAEKLPGVQEVLLCDGYVEFYCGGRGLGSSTSYYGFYFSESPNANPVGISVPEDLKEGESFRYKQADGDNEFIVEKLADGFYYYEAHF